MGYLSDLPPAASACHPLHRHRHERGGAYHAAALHEQVCFAHHRRNDLFCAVWHSAGFAVCTGFYPVGTCCLFLRLCCSGYMGLCLVHPAYPVQGCCHGSAGRHHVLQHRNGRYQFLAFLSNPPGAFSARRRVLPQKNCRPATASGVWI